MFLQMRAVTLCRSLLVVSLATVAGAMGGVRPSPGQAITSDLDQFMADVLARRDENWKRLQQYLLDERTRLQVIGPTNMPLWGDERTYTWFIRDGFFVRSPLTANGVTIAEDERRRYEDEFLRRARARDRHDLPHVESPEPFGLEQPAPPDVPPEVGGLLSQSRPPQFIDNAYFLRFKFEAGRYALVGHESIDGLDVLRIEYYPVRLFSHEQEAQDRRKAEGRQDRREDVEAARERLLNKVALVTLWVMPATRQVVKYTFDNVTLDFLPGAWLFRVRDVKATMRMGEAFKGVWLPRDIDLRVGAMLAIGPIDLNYLVEYGNYREATATGRIVPESAR